MVWVRELSFTHLLCEGVGGNEGVHNPKPAEGGGGHNLIYKQKVLMLQLKSMSIFHLISSIGRFDLNSFDFKTISNFEYKLK